MTRLIAAAVALFLLPAGVGAQQQAAGFPPFGRFQDGNFDKVNVDNLNVFFSVPVVSLSGRGLGLDFALNYNLPYYTTSWTYFGGYWILNGGLVSNLPNHGTVSFQEEDLFCDADGLYNYHYFGFAYTESNGTGHSFDIDIIDGQTSCLPASNSGGGYALDKSSYYLDTTILNRWTVYTPSGVKIENSLLVDMVDTNGNKVHMWPPYVTTQRDVTDSMGRLALKALFFTDHYDYQVQDVNGNYQTTRVNLQMMNVKTNFNCPSLVEINSSGRLITSIDLPNGQSYTFTYEPTPGFLGYVTGRLQRVTLPTGGYYEYAYPSGGISCQDGTLLQMTRRINDGSNTYTWNYAHAKTQDTVSQKTWKTTVTAPQLPYDSARNDTVYWLVKNYAGALTSQVQTEKYYLGSEASNQLLRTVDRVFTCSNDSTAACQPSYTLTTSNETNPSQQSKVETDYDAYSNLLETREYDWGSGTVGPLLRRTTMTYLLSSAYTQRHILNRLTQTIVKDGLGNVISRADISYDTTSLVCQNGAAQHDDANYGCTLTTRGNPTAMTQYTDPVTPSGALTTTSTYDSLGNVRSVTDPGGHTTNFSYADNFSDGLNRNTYAFLTQVTKPSPFNSQTLSTKYYYYTGAEQSVTDENSRVTSFSYLDSLGNPDKFNRLRKTAFPDGGETTIDYNDSARTVTTTQKRTVTESISSTDVYSPLAQLSQQQMPGNRKIDYTYDPLGRQWKVTNPYVSTLDPTYGVTETQFDALGRLKKTIAPDSTFSQVEYQGNALRSTDPSGKQTIAQSDGIGRLTRVCEVTAGNMRSPSESCGMTGFGGTGYLTTVSYSVSAGQLITTTTQGAQTRIQKVDGAGRTIASRIAEVSAATDVTYGYDADGNQTSVTDPKGTVNFEYDALHRLIRKKHGATVVAEFSYDGTQANNAIGRLITETDGVAGSSADKTQYSYDTMGRVLTANRTVSSTTYNMSYTYDLLGNLTVLNYPSSSGTRRKVDYAYLSTGELNKVSDTTGTAFDYVTATSYSPLGPMSQLDLGNGVRTAPTWNNNGEMSSLVTNKVGGSTYVNLGYAYNSNGQIQQITDNLNSLKTEKYTYDESKRLLTAQRGPDTNIQRKYSYDYDRYGNRWAQTVVGGTGYGGTNTFNAANNHVTTPGFSYVEGSVDRGNLAAVSPASYTYNQENFMTAASSTLGSPTYAVDAQGRRVKKTVGSTTTDYFYVGADLIAEKNSATGWKDYIFFAGQRMAEQTGSTAASAIYLHTDHLGSTRVCTDANGNSNGTCDYEPYGELQPGSSCSVPTRFRFAGMDFDADTNLYHTWFREYDPGQGRWMSVDALAGSTEDPASLNRFTYVRADPINLVDALGLHDCPAGQQHIQNSKGDHGCTTPTSTTVAVSAGSDSTTIVPGLCYDVYFDGIYIGNTCGSLGLAGDLSMPEEQKLGNIKKWACTADVALNFGLGFIPGYNALKLVGAALGVSFNPVQNVVQRTSVITARPSATSAAAGGADFYRLYRDSVFDAAGGKGQLNRLKDLTSRVGFPLKSDAARKELESKLAGLAKLRRIASAAGTVANLLNAASAAYDVYKCWNTK